MIRALPNALRPLLLAAALALGALPAAAQPAPAPSAADQQPDPRKEFLARQIARTALMDLRFTPHPSPHDYELAAILLGIAREQTPSDQAILRRQLEAAANAQNDAQVLELSRALLALDPTDTVTQLRLITATIAAAAKAPDGAQDAEARLVQYERYLTGDKARYFDPSVRSRLALDAALLLRERGDDAGFIAKLKLATQLDSSHKEAAALAAQVYAQRMPDDAVGKVEMLQNLLMADPVDPNVHMAIARELAIGGAYKSASRFQQNAVRILDTLGNTGEQPRLDALVLMWQSQGPERVISELNTGLAAARDQAARTIRRLQQSGQPTENATKPEDVRLSGAMATLYILANAAAGEANAAEAAVKDQAVAAHDAIAILGDPNKRGKIDEQQARAMSGRLAVQLELLRLIVNTDLEAARTDIERSTGLAEDLPDAYAVLRGWLALRSGDAKSALDTLRPLTVRNTAAGVGVAAAHEALAQMDEAKAAYAEVVRLAPLDVMAAYARSRLLALGVRGDAAKAAALEAGAARIPAWIDELVVNPHRFVQLAVTLKDKSPEALDRTVVEVSLLNASDIPLAVGADRALNSRLLFAPRMDTIRGGPMELIRPEVVDIDRRLRLMPQERITVTVWPDSGQTGWFTECLANRSVRVLWRVIQGFVTDPRGGFRPGPMCVATETDRVLRRPTPEASLDINGLAARIATEPSQALMRLAGTVRADVVQPLVAPGVGGPAEQVAVAKDPEDFKPVGDAFAARYARLDATDRAILVMTVPHANLSPGLAPLDAAAKAEADPTILALVLATRITDPADPLLAKAKDSDNPRLSRVATLLVERLQSPQTTFYSRLTPAMFKEPGEAGASSATGEPSEPPSK